MKKPTFLRIILVFLFLFQGLLIYSQNLKPFGTRFDTRIKGDMLLIGNNILNRDENRNNRRPNDAYNGTGYNSDFPMNYIDIDGDPSTFSSSSAQLSIPNPACYKIVYAGLYWGAILQSGSRTDINKVKLKLPTGGYNDIIGEVVYDANTTPIGSGNKPYACYADVTSLLSGLADAQGTYTVADVISSQGNNGGTGLSAGWSLFVIYEDPLAPAKYITSFDGFSGIGGATTLDIPISGFRTIPTGPVRVKFAFSALEGDQPITGDYLEINGSRVSAVNAGGTTLRPNNNFFNSSVTYIDPASGITENFLNRTPASTNTLGYDAGILNISNPGTAASPGGVVIGNNATSATIRLGSTRDVYFYYFNAFAVDIIEPKIVLTKIVKNAAGVDIGNTNVTLGDYLNYEIGFRNIGNDDAASFTIKDKLPVNILFDPNTIVVPNGSGITYTYTAATRTLIFTIPNNLVKSGDNRYVIKFAVQVVPNCNDLSDACADRVENQAFATYKGVANPIDITDDPSISVFGSCNLATPSATNFLVGIDGCKFTKTYQLCGANVDITAANNYNKYEWSRFPFVNGVATGPIIGTTQTITVSTVGIYYVHNTAEAPCISIDETVTVEPFGTTIVNPVIPFADETVICPNNGKPLPNIYLCGDNDKRLIRSGITDTTDIIWERSRCPLATNTKCADETNACVWDPVAINVPDFNVDREGQYRVTLNYPGGCFNRYFFNVYENKLSPTATSRDIICTTKGEIVVGSPAAGSGYEYSLDGTAYQPSNIFSITTPNTYTVYIRATTNLPNACVFTIPPIQIRQRDFTVTTTINNPLCHGNKGSVKVAANDVREQYYFELFNAAGVSVKKVGPIIPNDETFDNLDPGTYTIKVETEDGCDETVTVTLIEPDVLTASAAITKPLTCEDGEITVTPVGGTGPFTYFVNSTTVFQDSPIIDIAVPGTYTIQVVDANNCSVTVTQEITANPKPIYSISDTQVLCYGANSGAINFNVTAANGYTLAYSIDNGVTYFANGTFSNLAPGTYTPVLKYTLSGVDCFDTKSAIDITEPTAPLTATISATDIRCSASGTVPAVVTVTASGGTGTLQYSFNGSTYTTSNTYSTSAAGSVTAYVKDANNCRIGPLSIPIAAPESFTSIDITDSGWDCSTTPAGGHVNIAAHGVSSPKKYSIISGPVGFDTTENSDGEFKGLAPGAYVFQARDTKTNCTLTRAYTIKGTPDIVAGGSVTTPILCFGGNGSIQFTVSGLQPDLTKPPHKYDYVITNTLGTNIDDDTNQSAPTINLTNLPASAYTIVVKDRTTDCTATYTINLTQPTAALSISPSVPTNVNCNNDVSQLSVTVTGGTPNYSYAFAKSPSASPTSAYGSSTVLTVNTNSGADLLWDVYVKDANGCIAKTTVTVVLDALPAVTAVVNDQCTALGSTFTITATGTGLAPLEYGIAGPTGAFQTSPTFTVAAGTYTVSVKDKNACVVSTAPITVYPQLIAAAAVTKTLDCSASPNAVITTTFSGGKSPYTYTVQKGAGAPSAATAAVSGFTYPVSNANADVYTFVITDANGCPTTTSATVTSITDPTVTATPTQVSCFGGANGAVSLVGAGGSGGFTYSFNGSAFTATTNYTGLSAGIAYTYQVKDSKGCVSAPATIMLTEPTQLAATVTEVPFSCSTTNTPVAGTITINATAGTAPYQYRFNSGGFGAFNVLTLNDNGADQSYTYEVRDANGCIVSGSGTLLKLNPPAIASISGTPIYCTPLATTSDVTVSINGGTGVGTITYEITAPAASATSNTMGVFTGLAGGITYTFKVTDANGCFAIESHTVDPVTPIAVTATKLSDVDCNGNSTGAIRYNVSGFSGTYSYSVNGGTLVAGQTATTFTLNNLVDNTYNVVFTDEVTQCTITTSTTITEPTTLTATYTTVNANCNVPTSRVEVFPVGGTPGYLYSFTTTGFAGTFAASKVADLDPALTWTAYIKDLNGCTTSLVLTLVKDPVPTVSAVVLNQCSTGSTFQIQATGAGGIAPYTYTINIGLAPSPADTFTVAAGTYTITATDANGCPATTTVTVNQALTATAIVTKDITCSLPQEATIRIDAFGGKPIYSYKVSFNGGPFTAPVAPATIIGNVFTTNVAGTYKFEVTDTNLPTACTVETNNVIVTDPAITPVNAAVTYVDPTCNGSTDGSIKLVGSGGEAPYTYSISGVAGLGNVNVFGGLSAGPYNYIVRDAKGCDATGTVNLTSPLAITIDPIVIDGVTCGGSGNIPGSISISNTSGGTGNYTYNLFNDLFMPLATSGSTALNNHIFTGLNFGDYYVTIVDAKGCAFTSGKLSVKAPIFTNIPAVIIGLTCVDGASVLLTADGVAPFTYSIVGNPNSTLGSPILPVTPGTNTHIFNNVPLGSNYLFVVTDTNGCTFIENVPIGQISSIAVTAIATDVTCNGTNNGIVNYTVSGYDPLATGLAFAVVNTVTGVSVSTGTVAVAPLNAGTPVSYTLGSLPPGSYSIYITEVGGTVCTAQAPFDITQPTPLTATISNEVNANCITNATQLTIAASGGTAPYQYAFVVNGLPQAGAYVASNLGLLTPGTILLPTLDWDIWVKDANGCEFKIDHLITKDPTPVITLSVVDKCVAQGTFGILVTETTAGTGAYSISVDGSTFASIASLPYTVTGLNSGSHTIIIKDANGCTDSKTITIDAPLEVTPAIDALPTCANNDGQITLAGTGGTGTYTYTISPSPASVVINNATGVISGLPAGTYTVTMTDTATPINCTTTAIVTLGTPTPVTFTAVTTPALCVGDSNGSITVTLLAGNNNPSYTYEIIAPITVAAQSSNVFTGLLPGTYTVRVNSGRGCSTDDPNVIVDPATPLTASAAFPPNTTCSTSTVITVTAGGGNPMTTGTGYLYNFNGLGYTSDNTYTVNDDGTIQTITYTVKDKNGCETAPQNVVINPLNKPTDLNFVVSTPPTCPVPTSGVTVTATNGVGALTFEIVEFNGFPTALYPPQTTAGSAVPAVFNNLPIGTYLFQVTDANGCTYQESETIAPVTPIAIVGTLVNDISCDAANGTTNNGSASFTVTGFSSTLNYSITVSPPVLPAQISNVADVITLTGLSAGTYIVTVTDNTTGCSEDDSVTITLPAPISFTATPTKVFCSQDVSTITVTAVTGGTGVYSYAVQAGGTATPPAAGTYTTSPILTVDTDLNPLKLSWDVYVKDANDCIAMQNVNITNDAAPTIAVPAAQCYVGTALTTDLDLVTTTFNGNKSYTVNGSAIATSMATFNVPGTYVLGIKDDNGCEAFVNYTIEKQLLANAILTKDLYCAAPVNATIDVTITDGVAPYSYQMYLGAVAVGVPTAVTGSTFNASVNAPGMYSFVITDSNAAACTVTSNVVEVTTPVNPTATYTKTDVSCINGNDGTITISSANGELPYTYTLTGVGSNTSGDSTGNYTGLPAGTYNFVVTDAKKCTFTDDVVIDNKTQVTATEVVTPFGCDAANAPQEAIVTITPAGGTPGYTYSFDGGATFQASASFTVNSAQTINYVVRDANGCEFTDTAVVAPYTPPTDMDITATPIYCNTIPAETTLTINSVVGGVGPFVYAIISPASAATAPSLPSFTPISFTNLSVGIYAIKVTDANGCSTTKAFVVEEADKISVTAQLIDDVYCNGASTGILEFTVSNYITSANYSFNLVPNLGTMTQSGDVIRYTGVAAGLYTFTVTDNTSACVASATYGVSEPQLLTLISTHTEITCVTANNDGSISATATGGWPGGYEFQLFNGATQIQDFDPNSSWTGLTAGNYTINVRDSKGCIDTETVLLANPTPIAFTATPSTTLLSCKGDTSATITVSAVTGGQGTNYLYTLNTTSATPMISSGPQANPVFTNLGAGTYTVTVTDGWGCSATSAAIVIDEPTEVVASLILASSQTCLTQSTLTLSATGGTGAYAYSTSASGGWTPMGGNSITFPVPVGTYHYYVRDANGCVSFISNDIVIDPLPTLVVTLDVQNAKISCKGDSNGVIVATATGGLGNYVYTLLDGAGNPVTPTPTQLTPGNFTQLPAGTYQVRVDSGDCNVISTGVVNITQPLLPVSATTVVTDVRCNGAGDGTITVTASGGTGVIKYAIAPRLDQFFDTGVFDNLTPGTYQIIVQDENGCYLNLSETIDEPQPIFVDTVTGSEIEEVCFGDLNAAFDINITGGVAPYSVSVDNINGTYFTGTATQTVFSFTGLTGGDHTVYIKDANNCTAEWLVSLDPSVHLDPKAVVTYGCDNNSPSNAVTVTLDASITNPADVDYALDGSTVFQASNVFLNVAPGTHTITARHLNSCEKITLPFDVLSFAPLALTLADGGLNEIVATATGGAGNYQYSFDGGNTFITSNKFIFYKTGDYTVTVRDANGCEATATRFFTFIDIKIPDVFTPNGDGNNDFWLPTNTVNYKDLTIGVYDRYGRKIATLREGQGWDGRYNGQELPTGDYWYILKLKNVQDDREFVGHFTLMR